MNLGYQLSSEEHGPNALVENARRAEEAGFTYGLVSDHFHPWIDAQGQSPFVWSVLGGIARETTRLRVGTGVTCPLFRMHPSLVAQAAATAAIMFEGRFFLGAGTGERLNEHITTDRWPSNVRRQAMLEEAIQLIRLLWGGGTHTFEGRFFAVDRARIYSLPPDPPPIYLAASGRRAAQLAARIGDGLVSVSPSADVVRGFAESGGAGKPRHAELFVCCAETRERAIETVMRQWPLPGLPPGSLTELATPSQFSEAAQSVTRDALEGRVVLGPDPAEHIQAIERYAQAGFDHVHIHQIGPDQQSAFRLYEREILPEVGRIAVGARA
jgi:coenzyme F420-dependent glucose-6-phosphate dehydrogenase